MSQSDICGKFIKTFVFIFSIVSQVLSMINNKGFDVKALRAFRVLRPLRLVSRAPSKYNEMFAYFNDFLCVFIDEM